MKKRAQAAMEFLMTYGWALILVIVAIGALAFFGVLNPSKLTPEQCVLGPGFACSGFKLDTATNTIQLNVQNGFGKTLDLFLVHVKTEDDVATDEDCGGRAGFTAGNAQWVFGLKPPDKFLDGQLLSVYSKPSPAGAITLGILCNSIATTTCCTNFNGGSMFGAAIGSICPYAACATTAFTKGKKYTFNLVVSYREVGSSLIHQRVGTLSAVAE